MQNDKTIALYQELESDLRSLIPSVRFSKNVNMKLERIIHLLSLLGNPHNSFPSIHITGTSGKGSTSTMIASILSENGYKTGLFLSPHLQIINECYQINNQYVATSRLYQMYKDIKPAIEQVARESPFGSPSIFEAQVALAFYLFQEEKIDVGVIEVGLGGKLDATNVLQSQVAVLTNIGLDHTEILGDTIELIAQDKAGIVKPNQIVVSGLTQPSTKTIVADACKLQGAVLWQLGQTFDYHLDEASDTFRVTCLDRTYNNMQLSLQGGFQIMNASCAITAVHAFTGGVSDSIVRKALRQAFIPGRMECVQHNPIVVLDGAHNPDKIRATSTAISKSYSNKRKIVVLSLKSDKAYQEMMPFILRDTSLLIVTAFNVKGMWEPYEPEILARVAAQIYPNLEIIVEANPIEAIKRALAEAEINDLILVTGSLYLIGDIREYWHPSNDLIIQAEHM